MRSVRHGFSVGLATGGARIAGGAVFLRRFTILTCVVVALVAVPPAWATHDPTNCSDVPSTVLLETQAWWNPMPGPVTHPGTGKTGHVHLSTCFPLNGMLPDPTNPALGSPLKLGVRVQLHDHPGKLVAVRWSDASAIKEQIPESLTCATEHCEKQYVLTLDASKFDYSGWREVRFTADTRNTDATRFFNTTRWCVFVTNGKSRQDYCGGNVPQRCATAGWYTNLDYVNTYYDCLADPPGSTVSGTWCFRAKFERAYGFASVDPAYHATPTVNEGTVIYNGVGGNVWRDLCLDTRTIANGPHRLFLRSDALGTQPKGKGSGVFTLPFNVANA
jgi:hypothetical protein